MTILYFYYFNCFGALGDCDGYNSNSKSVTKRNNRHIYCADIDHSSTISQPAPFYLVFLPNSTCTKGSNNQREPGSK